MNHLNRFLKAKSIADIKTEVEGELLCHSDKHATFLYGNGELIVLPADESPEQIYGIDNYGQFNDVIVEL